MESKVTVKCPHCRRDVLVLFGVKEQGHQDNLRAIKIAADYIGGKTLGQLGSEYGVSRERVRQIVGKFGLTGDDGGQKVKIATREERKKRHCKKCGVELVKYQRDYCTNCAKTERVVKARKYNKAARLKKQIGIHEQVRDALVDTLASKV